MAKRKKKTALQRRRQKEKERRERQLYQEGKIPPQEPKSTTKRLMEKQQLQNLALDLFDEAYKKY